MAELSHYRSIEHYDLNVLRVRSVIEPQFKDLFAIYTEAHPERTQEHHVAVDYDRAPWLFLPGSG